jgi:hypothetical protein
MDIKTLEYMELRAEKGRNLANKINVITKTINLIENCNSLNKLDIDGKNGSRDLIRRYEGTEEPCFNGNPEEELFSILKPSIIEAFNNRLNKLQKEMEEI